MPIGFLLTLVVLTLCTALALRPIRRPRPLALASFQLAMVVSELPQLAALALVASTALAVGEGDVVPLSGAGLATLVVSAALLAGHVVLVRRAARAPRVLRAALRRGFGGAEPPGPRPRLHVIRWLVGFVPVRPRSVVRVANLRYGEHRRQRLDVYHPRSLRSGAPVLVYLHGGGYFGGRKRHEAQALLHRLVARGWVCVSADYRVRPSAGFEEHLADARAALQWARTESVRWGGDPATLVVAGSSAGGHLATLIALDQGDPAARDDGRGSRSPVSAALGLYGYYGRYYGRGPDESVVSTPLALDASGAPAVMLVDAELDTYVGTAGGEALAAHLRARSRRPVVHAVLPGAQHAFDVFRSLRFEAVVDAAVAFLDGALAGGSSSDRGAGSTAAPQLGALVPDEGGRR